jgi:ABC-type transporter Mla subunit MlaD
MRTPTNRTRIIIFALAVAAVVLVVLVTGSADDKAEPGSGGRVPVTYPSTDDSR